VPLDARTQGRPRYRPFDLHPDGQRFALAATQETAGTSAVDHVRLILNFFDELRRVAPASK
jgi:hypothetical protein